MLGSISRLDAKCDYSCQQRERRWEFVERCCDRCEKAYILIERRNFEVNIFEALNRIIFFVATSFMNCCIFCVWQAVFHWILDIFRTPFMNPREREALRTQKALVAHFQCASYVTAKAIHQIVYDMKSSVARSPRGKSNLKILPPSPNSKLRATADDAEKIFSNRSLDSTIFNFAPGGRGRHSFESVSFLASSTLHRGMGHRCSG